MTRKDNLITKDKLSELSGIKVNDIIKYVRQGILSYEREDENLTRFYNKEKSLKRLKEIKRLEGEGHDLRRIREFFTPDCEEDLKDFLE